MSDNKYYGRDLEAMSWAKNYNKWILDEIREYIGSNILEVGAGSGNFSKLLLLLPIKKLTCLEPSQNMFKILSQKLNSEHKVILKKGGIEILINNKNKEKFDTVLYINVLEHIEKDEEELINIYEILENNGHLIIFVPAFMWLYSNFDRKIGHFRRYDKKNLETILREKGFEILKSKYFDMIGIILWLFFFKILGRTLSSSNVSLYDKIIVPLERKIEKKYPHL